MAANVVIRPVGHPAITAIWQDLFLAEAARGLGLGRALIEAV